MDKLTLDTNVIRDWAWAEERSNDHRYSDDEEKKEKLRLIFRQLREYQNIGGCEFAVTTQLYTDFEVSTGKLPEYIEDMLGNYVDLATPATSTFPLVFPVVFVDKGVLQQILQTVFSGPCSPKTMAKRKKDALQLYAHSIAHRDYFLTSDQAILRAEEKLSTQYAIHVMSLNKYMESLPNDIRIIGHL